MLLAAAFALVASSSSVPASVTLTTKATGTTDDNFLGFTYDAIELKNRDRWLDWSDPLLFTLAKPLSGATLRVGGSLANHMRFVLNGTAPATRDNQTTGVPVAEHVVNDTKVWLMDISDHFETVWDQIYAFSKKVGFRLVFQLSPCSTRFQNKSWDPTNARAFFDYIHRHGQDTEGVLVGFEFVNEPFLFNDGDREPFRISSTQLGTDFVAVRKLMAEEFGRDSSLFLQGPDISTFGTSLAYAEEIVSKTNPLLGAIDQLSVHNYPFSAHHDGCEISTLLGDFSSQLAGLKGYKDLFELHRVKQPLVVSESAAVTSGCVNITDSFADALWFSTWLGAVGELGYQQLYRQVLWGQEYNRATNTTSRTHAQKYSLVNLQRRPPFRRAVANVNPSYFVAVLWRRLMGSRRLKVETNVTIEPFHLHGAYTPTFNRQRSGSSYSSHSSSNHSSSNHSSSNHSSRDSTVLAQAYNITLSFSNWGNRTIEVDLYPCAEARYDYILSADSKLQSRHVWLNGHLEWLRGPAELVPALMRGSSRLVVSPRTLGFVVLTISQELDASPCGVSAVPI
jgi:hypothetical protein